MPEYSYIHIPFCRRKCLYCAFTSLVQTELIPEYLKSLHSEIRTYYTNEKLKTLYIGGGTPSLLNFDDINKIVSFFQFDDAAEITVEINPESADLEFLQGVLQSGVNRVSIGVQSFNDEILKTIGRLHDSEQSKDVILMTQKAGFDNVSVDFIYGLPGQSMEQFLADLALAVELGVSHISLYGLKIEQGTPFFENTPDNIADSDLQADMYIEALKLLADKGVEHYEISNFALCGKFSRHNTNYWNSGEYYGFGAAAHGYIDGVRYVNNNNISEYIKSPLLRRSSHLLTQKEKIEEAVFLGFRRAAGINFEEFKDRFNVDFLKKYSNQLNKYRDFFKLTDQSCSFTTEGFLVSNTILADFLED